MRHLPVHWSEGLFLRPHHLQAADRHWAELLALSERWDHSYGYGLRLLEYSDEAIANHHFQVHACHARMRDGTLVSIDPGQEPDRVDLRAALDKEGSVQVLLGVPKLKMGAANVSLTGPSEQIRYRELTQSVQDESAGGNDQEIQFRATNVRVLLSSDETEGYELLPIARIERAGQQEATPRLDRAYIPPLLAVDAWPPLALDIVRAIYDIIGKKVEVLGQQVINRAITLASQEPGDLDRLLMLHALNQAHATLGVLAFARGVHPLTAYTELCRVVGQLSIFSAERRVPEVPRYDHDDLAGIFRWVRRQIELLLMQVRDYEYEQRFFVGEGQGMRVSLESKWLASEWTWFVGVQHAGLSGEECLALLSPGVLDWKLGSSRQVDALFEFGAEGLHLTPLAQAPRALPPRSDWSYFQVSRQNAAWDDVLETQTLAMRLKDTLIANRASLQGERKLVVASGGQQVALQFALFAVPSVSK